MTKTIWEVIEEHSKKEKTAEQVLQAVGRESEVS